MNAIWSLTIDDYLEVVRRSKEAGLKEGDSMEEIFIAYMREKGQSPIGHTELTREEQLNEMASHGQSILDIQTDKEGKTTFKVIKPEEK